MIVEINPQPSGTETWHVMLITLEGRRYELAVYTNKVDGRWYHDLRAEGGEGYRGVALTAGVDLIAPYRHLDMPPGVLFVTGTEDPDLDAFREKRARLLYEEAGT